MGGDRCGGKGSVDGVDKVVASPVSKVLDGDSVNGLAGLLKFVLYLGCRSVLNSAQKTAQRGPEGSARRAA